ncbi:MAG: 30S ribosomal protein S8 [Candidatus Thermoplasmatota archaeon]|jgi:small subunit ribosomal protein S8|nr:30S ribosomal protein S8 [Candidatus Thermoplasmatota archaeon]MCL5984723.1 30S ribosomal protein S8 [Candidatus Thermoplasmatota archaeon]
MQDVLNDALARIRNADSTGKQVVELSPVSGMLGSVLGILKEHGYVGEFSFVDNQKGGAYRVNLLRRINYCGVIKPRLSVGVRDLERFEARFLPAQDFGLLILSTNNGVMTQMKARELGTGGRLVAYVY